MNKNKSTDNQLKVFISSREAKCDKCGKQLGKKALISLKNDNDAWCLKCSGLNRLAFLPSGDVAMTRRAKKYSALSAIVFKWRRRRRRYERQGLLVEEQAITRATEECHADADKRQRRQAQVAVRTAELDKLYIKEFAGRLRELFPYCPVLLENEIAEHACKKYSGRVGRSANAKELNEQSIRLAVIAHIRHTETNYDKLLESMVKKVDARKMVYPAVNAVLKYWGKGEKC